MFRLSLFFLCFMSPVSAAEFYKCTDASGTVSYQAQPCAANEDVDKVKVDNTPNEGYIPPTYPMYTNEFEPTVSERIEQRQNEYAARRDAIIAKYEQKKCERRKGYLSQAEDKWDRVRRQGYRQWEKEHYEGLIEKRENEMKIACQ